MRKLATQFLKQKLRTGRLFKKHLKESIKRETYTPEEMESYRLEKMKETLRVASSHVPFYKRVFKERGLSLKDFTTLDDIKKLPIIDKQVVRENFNDLRNPKYFGLVAKGSTSGTSGTPSVFLRDYNSINYERAALWRQYMWAGKKTDSRRVHLKSEIVCPVDRDKPPFWKYNHSAKELVMSSFHVTDEYLKYYVDEIKKYKPYDLYAFPSTGYFLANYCKRNNIELKFSAVFTTAEILYDYQREEMEEVFHCKVFDQYGCAERVINIAQCEYGTYHEMPDYSLVEYLPVGDNQYQVVGTTLFNRVMPLIRYNTGDLVEFMEDEECGCKRNYRSIKRIIGRSNDAIKLRDGKILRNLADDIFINLPFIKEGQIIQHSLDLIEIKVVPLNGSFSDANREKVLKEAHHIIGSNIEYKVTEVDEIERGKTGKFKVVKSLISN